MAKPKSVLLRMEVDLTIRSHDCQHNSRHRLHPGDKRLKVTKDRTSEHFCVACALEMIDLATANLQAIAAELRQP
jgi:hypothetical protein